MESRSRPQQLPMRDHSGLSSQEEYAYYCRVDPSFFVTTSEYGSWYSLILTGSGIESHRGEGAPDDRYGAPLLGWFELKD